MATKIADELENHVLETGMQKITTHASITAKPFFEKRGYKVINEQTVELRGQLFTNFLMILFVKLSETKLSIYVT
ncbi:TPA: GNAT family N-acetyltransferase, partial [Enterococcus faecium]|nr:GNAT family N-acetyltransferase [Enterococcus faecium]MCH0091489.1 GNAT family N-acetyltransferase [Enterococcus faecium]HAP8821292.1 GNAT family N-acetyltransferase [Enterococcus faecium]HAR0753619.1 GNAT family N-acetyltransferase [Enterococcus faecium]HBK7017512.1 GNAT family N-acetyltransferase [Enterococcus faecium]